MWLPCKKYFCPCKKKSVPSSQNSPPNQDPNGSVTKIDIIHDNKNTTTVSLTNTNGKKPIIIIHEPQNDPDNLFKIVFENYSFGNTSIFIDPKKTIDDLIRFYFETCKRPDLYGDKSIYFLINGENITYPYPKKLIETLKTEIVNSITIKIVVYDNDDKMKKK